jgi:outer membrane protein TolC
MKAIIIRYSTVAALAISLGTSPAFGQAAPGSTVSLTLADAVQRALEHNPDLAIVRSETEVEAARVGESRGAYTPLFSTSGGRTRNVTPPANALLGDAGVEVNDWFSSTGVRQRVPWGGGAWSLSWETARTTTNSPISSFDPNLQSGIQAAFSQPLLKDRQIDSSRRQYTVAKRNQQSSELQFREAVVQTVAAVKQAYWTAKAANANVTVQQRSLELAEELARQNRIRVDAGQIPPLDLVQAEAEVAQRRENLIQARATAGDAEDHLRRLIMDPADTAFWKTSLDPVDSPPAPVALPDADAAVAQAMGERLDLARAANDLENAKTEVAYLGNQRLPDVRLEALYRGSGLGGTQLVRAGGFPGTVTDIRQRSFGAALGQAFTTDYPTWSLGVSVSYPLGRSAEEAGLARASIERDQASRRLASLRLDAAEAIRRAARQVSSSGERVEAAKASATLAERRLADEQRRYDVGLSTTFLVTQAQRDLLQAQVGLLQTSLDYQSAAIAFEALQQAPAPGSAGVVLVRGADVVVQPPPSPRGLFRPGSGQ